MGAPSTPKPGAIVAWWNSGQLAFGLAAGEEKQRIRLLLSGGKQERVSPSRIALSVTAPGLVPSAAPEEQQQARDRIAEVEARVRSRAATVDVGLVWEIVIEGVESREEGAGPPGPLELGELAELAFDSTSDEARTAVMLALLEDGLHFVRKGGAWTPRTREAVEDLRDERIRVAEREARTREFFASLEAARRGEPFVARGNDVERRYLEALEELALQQQTAPDNARNVALQALEAAGQRWTRPHEGAFRLLRRIGRFASDDENLQVPRFGLRTEFPPEVLELAAERARTGFDSGGRTDLTALEAVSVDGPDTKEIDDLLSLEPRAGGGVRLGVHIADPASFVTPGDPVDDEALARGLTHYMPDLRLPMLPPAISEEAASLLPGSDRPALSFLIEVGEAGDLAGFEILRSIVRSSARLEYGRADRAIESGAGPFAGLLRSLAGMGRTRLAARVASGAISIRAPEAEVHVEDDGTIRLDRMPEDSASRLAVTEAMVLAGDVVARFCLDAGLPTIYRRQAAPGDLPEVPPAGEWDPVATRRVRRSLKRAESGLKPGAHAGLGLEAYVQASSPLRRFQDLAVHRQVISALLGRPPCYDREALQRVASTTDRAEADARRAENAADEYWLLRYLEGQAGADLDARVVETEPRPVVLLERTLVEQPMNGLAGVEPGQRIRVRVEQVNPRAGLLVLRRVE